ncbi:MAG: DNA polymerase/3'-5' exonuclease PolX [Ignavibacteriales bacterium]|nr:DNA polymerase/3'-5' exonuclease PolX [Ignavibacteriales bacterium]
MDKKRVAEILEEMGTILDLQGANPFRSRAFHNGAVIIGGLADDLTQLVRSKTLTEVDGIGKGLAQIIEDLVTTGRSEEYETLRHSIPPGLLDIMRIPGLGPKRVKLLYERLGIESIEDLKNAAEQHRLSDVEGFGEKTEKNILRGIERLKKASDRHLVNVALEAATEITAALTGLSDVGRCEVAGSLRRRKELIGDIDIVVSAQEKDRGKIMDSFVKLGERTVAQGDTKSSILLKKGINCDLRIVLEREFPFALNYFTGSKEHNVEMRSLARKKGWSLNEYGFSSIEEGSRKRPPVCRDEEDLYEFLGLQYIPPELRENLGEFEAAAHNLLPHLVEEKDIRGTFHCHTDFSDGANSAEEMTEAVRRKGWKYWGVADHSRAAIYAGGMSLEKARVQLKAIDKLNEQMGDVRIFKGIECDILPHGTLDYPDSLLAQYDYVIASIHGKFNMTETESTQRLIKALKNKHVSMLGHPTGRVLLSRDGYPVKMSEVIQAASDYGKAIEINAHPLRLDLDWRLVRLAKEKHVPIAINPDAHNIDGLDDVRYGVGVARKGWLEKDDVLNTWSVERLESYFKDTKRVSGKPAL